MLTGIHLSHYGVLFDTSFGISAEDLSLPGAFDSKADSLTCAIKPITGLIGRNSTGKSALFDALAFISDCMMHGVQFASTQKGRSGFAQLLTHGYHDSMSFDLLLWYGKNKSYLRYEFELSCDIHHRPHVQSERVTRIVTSESNDSGTETVVLLELTNGQGTISEGGRLKPIEVADLKFPALSVFGVITSYPELQYLNSQISRWYFCSPQKNHQSARTIETGGHHHLNESCSNIRNVLDYFRKEHADLYRNMIRKLSKHIPDSKQIDDAFLNGEITSGILRLFTFVLLLEDPNPRPLICLEEPDNGLYHDMVDLLLFEMRDYTMRNPGCQILFTTHNPYVLESLRPDEVWVFERYLNGSNIFDGQTTASARCIGLDPVVDAMYRQGVGMGAMWYGGHFDRDGKGPYDKEDSTEKDN